MKYPASWMIARAIAFSILLEVFSLVSVGAAQPGHPLRPRAVVSPADETPRHRNLRSNLDLNNPSKHDIALNQALAMELEAEKLEREGERLASTRDFVSALDGRSTDNSFYRRKGQAMIEQARLKREDAILVRQLVDKRKKELKQRAATSALTPYIEWKNPTGASTRARIITFDSGQAIIERQDGELFQIPLSNVAAAYHPLFDVVRLKEFGLKARGVCELSKPGEHGLRGEIIYWNEALLWVRTPAGDIERIANNEGRDLRRELLQELERAKQEESALDVLAGKRVKFTVRRVLSPQYFPDAAIWGEHLYEVAVANDYALFVTNHTSYITRGTGELRLRHARNLDTYLDNGSLRTVPVLVEVEQPSVRAYEEAVKTRARIEAQLGAVEENQEVYATIFSN